jgi:hypothetical protein
MAACTHETSATTAATKRMDATSWGLNAETRTRPLGSTAAVLENSGPRVGSLIN